METETLEGDIPNKKTQSGKQTQQMKQLKQ